MRAMILDRVQNQHATIRGFAADAPFLEEIDGIALDVGAIQRIDGDERDLGVRLFVDLLADLGDLRDGVRIKNVCEIVDVAGRLELRNRFGPRPYAQRKTKRRA